MAFNKKNSNPFEIETASMRLTNPLLLVLFIASMCLVSLIIVKGEILGIALVLGLAIVSAVVYLLFTFPRLGIILLVIQGFLVIGLSRYIPAPFGLTLDGVMFLLYVALFFKAFTQKVEWTRAKSQLTFFTCLWMGYILLQIINPEARSIIAWFYAMRGYALYSFLVVPLAFILFNKPKDLKVLFIVWGVMSVLGTLKGIMQFTIGVDPFEQAWLDGGGHVTHILFGKLRIFSFYSDAGQFGAAQGHAGIVFGILALFRKKASLKLRVFYLTVCLFGLYGLLISGTRGAIAVPGMGAIIYLILSKNIKLLTLGGIVIIGVYVFFAHTNLLQSNAEIQRIRTAFDPNNPSLRVRLENQKKLSNYLESRPFGGGVGASGNWGQRFSPNTFLANTATDSWYVAIWADTGIVGLLLYLIMIFFVLLTGAYNVMFKIKNQDHRIMITALTCGFAGIMMASYANGVFGQMPTAILMYLSMVFIFSSKKWGNNIDTNKNSII